MNRWMINHNLIAGACALAALLFVSAAFGQLGSYRYDWSMEIDGENGAKAIATRKWEGLNPDKLKYTKTGWPRLKRYRLFNSLAEEPDPKHTAICSDCGSECEVPFKPDPHRPVYCRDCWAKRRPKRRKA